MRVLMCGSRDWDDERAVRNAINGLCVDHWDDNVTIIEGGARGADALAERLAKAYALEHEQYKADWDKHGKGAGHIRNKRMLDTGIDLVIAFKDGLNAVPGRGGTEHMVRIAKEAGVPVWVISHG